MGLSIYYNGRIAKPELLPGLIEEIKDVAETCKWNYHIYDQHFPDDKIDTATFNQNIYGISFTPPKCETIFICFLSNGRMSSPVNLKFYGEEQDEDRKDYLYMLSTKTQYAGMAIHKFIIELFRYLNSKYLADFKMIDESGYWETNDEKVMEASFKRYNDLMDNFALGLENIPIEKGENIENYFERILKRIKDREK